MSMRWGGSGRESSERVIDGGVVSERDGGDAAPIRDGEGGGAGSSAGGVFIVGVFTWCVGPGAESPEPPTAGGAAEWSDREREVSGPDGADDVPKPGPGLWSVRVPGPGRGVSETATGGTESAPDEGAGRDASDGGVSVGGFFGRWVVPDPESPGPPVDGGEPDPDG